MRTLLSVLQVAVPVLLIVAILLQARGTGLGGVFGGEGMVFRTKRGIEKLLLNATIVLSIIFFAVALAHAFIAA